MRSLIWLFLASATCRPAMADHGAAIPTCAAQCFTQGVQNWTCPLDDPSVQQCVQSACIFKDVLVTTNVSSAICNLDSRDRGSMLGVSTYILAPVAVLCVVLRLLEKPAWKHKGLDMIDDWIMAVNAVFLIGTVATTAVMTTNGYGKDMWALSFDQIAHIMKALYAGEILYNIILAFTKLSILCFYLRIFQFSVFPALRIIIFVTMGVTAASGLAFSLAMVFQCTPIDSFWNFLEYNERGDAWQCININACGWSHGAVTISLDLLLMVLPMPELLRLSLPWRKKLRVCIMFAMGGFVTVVEIPRLLTLHHFRHTTNPTYDLVYVGLWAGLEIYVGVICACLPRISLLFSRLYRRSFPISKDGKPGTLEVVTQMGDWSIASQTTTATCETDGPRVYGA